MAKILLVDDEQSAQTLVGEMLRSGGHEVVEAYNGQEAIMVLKEEQVDAVVTDLRMPLVNGLRLIRALRAQGDTMPIIAISGANKDQLLLAQDYGANAGLVKPLDRAKLLDILERTLADSRDSWANAWIHPEFGSVGER
jgi:CheY-like chemotaxis protein